MVWLSFFTGMKRAMNWWHPAGQQRWSSKFQSHRTLRAHKQHPLAIGASSHIFTRVVLFGTELVRQLFKDGAPMVLGSARILVTAGLEDLAVSGAAKLEFWNQLSGKSHRN